MLKPNHVTVLFAVWSMRRVAGYQPTIGEIAKVCGLSYGVVDRALLFLCKASLVTCHEKKGKRVKYRFSETSGGYLTLKERGWVNGQ